VVQQAQLAPISAEELAKRSKLAIWQSLQRAGYNPQFSYLGRQLLDRSERLTPLAMAGLGNDANAVDKFGSFSDAYTQAMLKGGTGGGQFDLSRSGQRGLIDSAFQNATPGSDMYGFLTQGDPEEQFNRWRGFEQAAQSGRFAPLVEAGLANKQAEFTNFLGKQLSGDESLKNTSWIDVALGRQGPGAYAGAPPPGTTGPGAVSAGQSAVNPSGTNPNPSTAQAASGPYARPTGPGQNPTAYGIGAAGPQGSLTPPISATQSVNPNLSTFPSAPGNPWEPLPGQTGAPPNATPGATTFQQLMQQYGGDRKNWSTRMMGNPSQGFSIGGVTYNPQAEAAQGSQRYRNMSGQGRETARGSNFGVFMYRLAQLTEQRNAGGNRNLGITPQTTDAQLAQMAAQFVGKNYVGQSAFTGA
jgi:hypothetical protein